MKFGAIQSKTHPDKAIALICSDEGKEMTQRPLSGYRVIDFGQYIAGPAVAMMLADQGAEVIRIDPLDGPKWNSPAARVLNRGKKRALLRFVE
ncbi:CoA transferase [Kiloniella sp.]|uniref:CoA transferase n=1 Tax=Kiloniella sp. TaxID=1938587 RepID=UPI003B029F8D